jgi:hypothetical protein
MAGDKVLLSKPLGGETVQVAIRPGCVYLLDFSPDESVWERTENDFLIRFDDVPGVMVLRRFFAASDGAEDFFLELRDGSVLSGRDTAEVFSQNLQDLHTDAAGSVADAAGGDSLFRLCEEPEPLLFADAGNGGRDAGVHDVGALTGVGQPIGLEPDAAAHGFFAGTLPPPGDMLDCSPTSFFADDAALIDLDLLLPSPATPAGPAVTVASQPGPSVFASLVDFTDDGPDAQLLARLFLLSL